MNLPLTPARLLTFTMYILASLLLGVTFVSTASAQCNPNLAITHTGNGCAGDTLALTGIDSLTQITWYRDSTVVSTGTDSIYVPTAAGQYHAVVATSTCADTTATQTVAALPSATITVTGSLRRCPGDSVRLTAPAGNTYLWSTGDTSRIIYGHVAGPYNVTVTNAAGCSAVSANDTMVILPTVQPDVTISSDAGDTICMNTDVTFYAQSVNGGSNPQYQWKRNGVNVSNTATYIGTLLHDGEVIWCVLNSNATCATPRRDTSAAITMTVLANPSVSISGSHILCSGDTTTLAAQPAGSSYLWSTGATSSTLQVSAPGFYGVTVTDASGCSAGAQLSVATSATQQATITQNGDTLITAGTAQFYQWYYDGTIISGATGPVTPATESGFYQVATIDSNGCRSTSAAVAIVVSGVADIAAVSGMEVYPNPSAGAFTITWTDGTSRSVAITDAMGRKVLTDDNITEQRRQYDLSHVASGCYYVRVVQSGMSRTMKLVIAK